MQRQHAGVSLWLDGSYVSFAMRRTQRGQEAAMSAGLLQLRRYSGNPILEPRPQYRWEARSVFNCAVIRSRGLYHMLYRAVDPSLISSIGYAVSPDGIRWLRLDSPVLSPQESFEERGVEDPRVVEIEGTYYMTYTGYSRQGVRAALARSDNLITWERMGIVLPDENNKDHVLFPARIHGRYVMLHRRPPHIWIAFSHDLLHWEGHQILLRTRPGKWDCWRIGAAGPPIYTERGWVLIYHGVDDRRCYRLGIVVLDADDPTRVLYQQDGPILEPAEAWELFGDVPNVVFSCGQAPADSDYYVYYGAADSVIGLAIMVRQELEELLAQATYQSAPAAVSLAAS
jgi:predicted GH43/DUF377 family glycosyl hydrolase